MAFSCTPSDIVIGTFCCVTIPYCAGRSYGVQLGGLCAAGAAPVPQRPTVASTRAAHVSVRRETVRFDGLDTVIAPPRVERILGLSIRTRTHTPGLCVAKR